MAYIKQGNNMILWGRVTKDAQFRTSQSGKSFATLSVQYGKHHDEDGNMVRDYMDISAWGDLGEQIADPNVGIVKGDIVMVTGVLYKDDYLTEKEGKVSYRLNADAVFDCTSAFQLATMVTTGEAPENPPQHKATFVSSSEKTPFEDMLDEADGELPY